MGVLSEAVQGGAIVVTVTVAGEESSTVVQANNEVIENVAVATVVMTADDGLFFAGKVVGPLYLLQMARLCEGMARSYRDQYENLHLEGSMQVVQDLADDGFYDDSPEEDERVTKSA